MSAIRPCGIGDSNRILAIVNAAAEAYRGAIPPENWHEPYMSAEELARELAADVRFFGLEEGGVLVGVMGMQPVQNVTLIRHAYVLPEAQGSGVGRRLIAHILGQVEGTILVGTWAAAEWAIRFYEANSFQRLSDEAAAAAQRRYWNIPERQIHASVVLALENPASRRMT